MAQDPRRRLVFISTCVRTSNSAWKILIIILEEGVASIFMGSSPRRVLVCEDGDIMPSETGNCLLVYVLQHPRVLGQLPLVFDSKVNYKVIHDAVLVWKCV